jgi:hypothetical protein
MSTTNYYYTITLVPGTTSPGPYTIHLNQSGGIIPLLYPQLTLAQDIPQNTLLAGVTIETTGIPGSIVVVNEYCGNIVTIATPTTIDYKDICLSFNPRTGTRNDIGSQHFIPNGIFNGYPSWISDTPPVPSPPITITWDVNKWRINNFSVVGNTILSSDPSNSNPPLNWYPLGGDPLDVTDEIGDCYYVWNRNFNKSINDPTCLCDGSIVFNVTDNLDNPPFSYSIDNGVTYSSSPIFTNLCSGIYSLAVLDSLGNTYFSTETIKSAKQVTTYTISLSTTKTTPVNNNISVVNDYETTIVVTPPLPNGATITFDLIHTNSFYSSPTSGTSILKTGTILYKNLSATTINSTVTGNTISVNTAAGCQTDYIYQSNISDSWNSLTLSNSDTITISTTSRVDKTTTGKCVVGYSNDTLSISNAVISGCNCCSIKIN